METVGNGCPAGYEAEKMASFGGLISGHAALRSFCADGRGGRQHLKRRRGTVVENCAG